MKIIESAIRTVSPAWAFKREQYRKALAAYEAANPSRLRKLKPDNSSGDSVVGRAGPALRGYARQLEQNYDLASAVLDTLVDGTVGPNGISWEPLPKTFDGDIHEDFANELLELWKDIAPTLNVTWGMDDVATERLAARTLFRDGEYLVQFLEGSIPGLDHGSRVPFSIELIESDLLPFDLNDDSKKITQGVERNAWNRARAYHVLKQHPGADTWRIDLNTKRVSADKMLHPKLAGRFGQARGVSIFSPVITRIEDLKDYEESERVAARIAAALSFYIKKGTPEEYTPPSPGETERSFSIKPGMGFDNLRQGEDVGTIDSNRPSSLLTPFHDTMSRRVAAGTGSGNSSITKNYNGTYSAQRQELVENWIHYEALTRMFVGMHSRPIKTRFVQMAIASRQIKVPRDINPLTLYDADYRGPPMPWIKPQDEVDAMERKERAGYASAQQNIRSAGGNPQNVRQQIKVWRQQNDDDGLIFTTDPKHDKGTQNEAPAQTGASSLKEEETDDGKKESSETDE